MRSNSCYTEQIEPDATQNTFSEKPSKSAHPKYIIFAIFLGLLGIGAYYLGIKESKASPKPTTVAISQAPAKAKQPKISGSFKYTIPKIEKKREYQIFMVGDSMTHALGPHGGTFNEYMNELYKKEGHGILVDNYAVGSTNLLSLKDRMKTKTTYWNDTFEPLLSRKFDIILIESFGYNPLSQFPRAEGLKKQTEELDTTMQTLMSTHPNAAIIFVATIAPSKKTYAKSVQTNLTASDRLLQVDERTAFILNHIKYAKDHNIPLVNIYEKSIKPDGDGNTDYINPDDDIHPSAVGVNFIGRELTNLIYDSNILPK